MSKSSFERIHNIDRRFNRFFAWPIYAISTLVVLTLFVSPYSVRLVIAFLINLLMNRPKIYFAIFTEKIGRPLNLLFFRAFYFSIFAVYAILYQVLNRESAGSPRSAWRKSEPRANPAEDLRYQS